MYSVVAPSLSVVSEPHVVPSAFTVGAEHCWVTASNVPAEITQLLVGHPWQVPESQVSFIVVASPSLHLRFLMTV